VSVAWANGVSNAEKQPKLADGWRQPIELGSRGPSIAGLRNRSRQPGQSGLWCFLPNSGTDRSVVYVPTNPAFVEGNDLSSLLALSFSGHQLAGSRATRRGLRREKKEQRTASTFHFRTWSCTMPAIRSVFHHTLGLSWRSGWSRATHRLSSMPSARQEPASSVLLRSPMP
jgi:hypothetical protein